MSKTIKLILGALTVWPLFYIPIFIFVILSGTFALATHPDILNAPKPPMGFFLGLGSLMIVHVLTAFTCLGLIIFYIVDVLRQSTINQTEKIFWILGFFCAGVIAMPIYFFMNVWPRES